MDNGRCVGVFDSGWGGLSVALEVRALLPDEPLLYVADHAYCPYGGRGAEVIRSRATRLARELVVRGAKAIVVACNTASALAVDDIRAACPGVPVVGVVPAIKPAAAASRSGVIAVLATPLTAAGPYLERLIRDHAPDCRLLVVAAPELVGLVEAGETAGPHVEAVVGGLLAGALAAGADQIVLGCTHFPFLRPAIERVVGPGVEVVASGPAIARRLRHVLGETGALAAPGRAALRLETTGDPLRKAPVAARLLGAPVVVEALGASVGLARSG